MGKNMWKFDFNRQPRLRGHATTTATRTRSSGTSSTSAPTSSRATSATAASRGCSSPSAFKLFNLAGVARAEHRLRSSSASSTSAAETGTDSQYDGDFWGMYLAVEQDDGRFLDEHDLPDGNLYKMEGGTGELEQPGPDPAHRQVRPGRLPAAATNNPSQTDQWCRDNIEPRQLLRLPRHRRGHPPLRHRASRQELLLLPQPRHRQVGDRPPGTWT